MIAKRLNVLFVDRSNNSASILAERLLQHWGASKFQAYSAGIEPAGKINPLTIQILQRKHLAVDGLVSKSLNEFLTPDRPHPDIVIALLAKDEFELPTKWINSSILSYWNPQESIFCEVENEDSAHKVKLACNFLENRIKVFASLRFTGLIGNALAREVNAIGNYKLGNELLDSQHQAFLVLLSQWTSAMENGEPYNTLLKIAYQIQKYALFHFFSEEKYMSESGFPGLQHHCEVHTALMAELSEKFCRFAIDQRPENIGIFLEEWFLRHIHEEDIDFVNFLAEKQINSTPLTE